MGKFHAFRFIKTPYLDNMALFLAPWRLTVEIIIPYEALITGYFVFECNLANACASTTMFPKTDTVALALWASIFDCLFFSFFLFFFDRMWF